MIDGFSISAEKADMDIGAIHAYLSRSYWAEGIPLDRVKRGVENSLCVGVFNLDDVQVGFARAVTDSATFAYLCDVYILEDCRGMGLSKWLIETLLSQPQLKGLRRICLATVDAHGLYEKYGFTALAKPENFMEIWRPEIYQSNQCVD